MTAAVRTETSRQPVLEMRHISKTFGAIRALQDVSLTVHAGELHALMGENGAGKSTLMKVLSGAYRPDSGGEILIDGAPVVTGNPIKARAQGIAVIYQELSLAPNLTVAQNIFLGNEPRRLGVVDRDQCNRRAKEIITRLGVSFSARALVSSLSLGERQLVEIARALSTNARIIVMDEPTTSLTSRETDRLFEVIATLKSQGIAIIYISHRMEEVYQLADRVSVLRDSGYVGTLERADLNASRLVSMMVGRDLSAFYKKDHRPPDAKRAVALSVRGMSDGKLLKDCSFDLHKGEVLALAGLVGSGRTELARLIFGADRHTSGTLELDGKPVAIGSPREALDAGIAYLTEDRKELGLFLDMSISDNISMGVLARDARAAGFRDFAAAEKRAAKSVSDLSIRTSSVAANAGSLSGGNQQKVLLARLLETEPRVLILDEPTRGVDVGAKSEIYRLIDNLANRGIAILMISSELPEVIGVADRVLVMRDGAISGEVTASEGEPLSQEKIMELATGAAKG
ncbi:D-xylose ABC transporter ATP-binding protein [Mesorhizobium sanjuanii]|uniref:D-xylose ABC transporter ATP-binding protein n=1 Tax=Mesorhizobium sanjuanii TaxID=2037900 RepID=A0A2A6F9R5_9HYPH|nr:sugar ABC transporter ATP-binding protein [Mesorhizobium sanjuanii]PDQ18178.1 D-xylose ABC transporter ATP-binding protein [Mesorhizobium sanjuanii]